VYLQMNLLDNPLSTRPIQTDRVFSVEPYPNGRFGCIDNPVRQFGAGSVPSQTWTRNDGPELLLTQCPGNSTPRLFSSRTSTQAFVIRNYVSCIVARENPPLAISAIFKAKRMSDCSSCTRPPCLAIVADMLETNKEITCCIYILDSAITSTIYASEAFSHVVKTSLVHFWGFLSLNSSTKMPEQTIS